MDSSVFENNFPLYGKVSVALLLTVSCELSEIVNLYSITFHFGALSYSWLNCVRLPMLQSFLIVIMQAGNPVDSPLYADHVFITA